MVLSVSNILPIRAFIINTDMGHGWDGDLRMVAGFGCGVGYVDFRMAFGVAWEQILGKRFGIFITAPGSLGALIGGDWSST